MESSTFDCDLIFGNIEKMLLPILNKEYDKKTKQIINNEYIYKHLQQRKMHYKDNIISTSIIEILSDRFKAKKIVSVNKKTMRLKSIKFTYLYRWDKFLNKSKKVMKNV